MSKFAVILAAAGQSRRFANARRKKPFTDLDGRAVWLRSADLFANRDDVAQIIMSLAPDDIDWFRTTYKADLAFRKIDIVAGGAERADSVQNALAEVRNDIEYVAVHDAARPLLVDAWINEIFDAAITHGAAIPAIPTSSTVKRVRGEKIIETVPREELWQAQTPQVFRRDLLETAFAKRDGFQATDEAQLVERLGEPVHIVPGSPMNMKITTVDDFRIAEAILHKLPKPRTLRDLHSPNERPTGNLLDRLGE